MAQTISRLAAELGVKPDTIRYYERIGLLPQPDRTPGNYRSYDSAASERLRFIKGGQRLGLKLDEIRELLEIRDTGLCPCGHTATLLRRRIAALDAELERLSALRRELAGMMENWPEAGNKQEESMWHCAGETIALPTSMQDWICSGQPGCDPAARPELSATKGGENG